MGIRRVSGLVALGVAAAGAGLAPGAAQASNVQVSPASEYDLPPFSTQVRLFANDGEVNNVTVTGNGDSLTVVDTAGITAGPGCRQDGPTRAVCARRASDAPIRGFDAFLGDLNDRILNDADLADFPDDDNFGGRPGGSQADGGAGDDELIGSNVDDDVLDGGAGNDTTRGRGGDDFLFEFVSRPEGGGRASDGSDRQFGGPGSDFLDGGSDNDQLEGDDGDDFLDGGTGPDGINGGAGIDTLSYDQGFGFQTSDRGITRNGPGVGVTLNDAAVTTGNGQPGENDALTGLEDVSGTIGRDTLIGSQTGNILSGGGGDDVIDGAGGNPTPTGPPVVIREPVPTTPTRLKAQRITATLKPSRDRRAPYRFAVSGRLTPPAGVSRADACTGRVSVQVKAGKKTISTRRTTLRSNCSYRSTVTFRDRRRFGRRSSLKVRVRFLGNSRVLPQTLKTVTARVR